ncbi:unnamed protein product [Medioppia subpectinata]|uniref:Phosphorylated adapter RNA export protein n=1 Tax=Medioppia subpectinata TaxID=1979941 RepID=A0A7R9KRZ1_9ACAR|nr:unnamed protein product [Medioppia subpectinata]CAG2108660.1 unnamed protein product [Medioppia subpectinata]
MNRFHTFTKNESSDESSEEGELNDDSDDHNDQKPAIDGKDNHQLFDSKALKVSKSLEIMDKRDDNRAKNRFTLWSDILLEEELNHSVSNSMDIKKRQKKSTKFDRKSENYSFWTKKQLEDKQKDNCDQQLTQTTDNSDNKQTKSEKKRRKNKKKKKADKDIVSQIAYKLNEPKTDLLKTVYETIGPEKTSELCSAALDVQSSGGLMTADGKRRRTCGGIKSHLKGKAKGKEEKVLLIAKPWLQHNNL